MERGGGGIAAAHNNKNNNDKIKTYQLDSHMMIIFT